MSHARKHHAVDTMCIALAVAPAIISRVAPSLRAACDGAAAPAGCSPKRPVSRPADSAEPKIMRLLQSHPWSLEDNEQGGILLELGDLQPPAKIACMDSTEAVGSAAANDDEVARLPLYSPAPQSSSSATVPPPLPDASAPSTNVALQPVSASASPPQDQDNSSAFLALCTQNIGTSRPLTRSAVRAMRGGTAATRSAEVVHSGVSDEGGEDDKPAGDGAARGVENNKGPPGGPYVNVDGCKLYTSRKGMQLFKIYHKRLRMFIPRDDDHSELYHMLDTRGETPLGEHFLFARRAPCKTRRAAVSLFRQWVRGSQPDAGVHCDGFLLALYCSANDAAVQERVPARVRVCLDAVTYAPGLERKLIPLGDGERFEATEMNSLLMLVWKQIQNKLISEDSLEATSFIHFANSIKVYNGNPLGFVLIRECYRRLCDLSGLSAEQWSEIEQTALQQLFALHKKCFTFGGEITPQSIYVCIGELGTVDSVILLPGEKAKLSMNRGGSLGGNLRVVKIDLAAFDKAFSDLLRKSTRSDDS